MTTDVDMVPDLDLDLPIYSTTVRWTWPEGFGETWTQFRLVRSIASPVACAFEGSVIFETDPDTWGDPVYEDQNPPPNRWVYYNAFVLNEYRIWVKAGRVYQLGVGDHDWTIDLPELLPGVSVSKASQVAAKADGDQQLVEFLQGPAMFLDRVKSLGQTMRHFWDPLKVPPSMLPAMLNSVGFPYDETLPVERLRYVAKAMLGDAVPGTLRTIENLAEAASGYGIHTQVSNNHMLSVLDSSFEWVPTPEGAPNPLQESLWQPQDPLIVEVRAYSAPAAPANNVLPDEVLKDNYLHILQAATLTCGDPGNTNAENYGTYAEVAANFATYEELKNSFRTYRHLANTARTPFGNAIPIGHWKEARGGLFARSDSAASLTFGLRLYDLTTTTPHLREAVLVDNVTLTSDWTYYSTQYDKPVLLNASSVDLMGDAVSWTADWSDAATPQSAPAVVPVQPGVNSPALKFTWNQDPDPAGDIADQPRTARHLYPVSGIIVDSLVTFQATMSRTAHPVLDPASVMTPWRLVIAWGDGPGGANNDIEHSDWILPQGNPQTVELEWWAQAANAWMGIEVQSPEVFANTYQKVIDTYPDYQNVIDSQTSYQTLLDVPAEGGWASAQVEHLLLLGSVQTGESGKAWWGVPYITVTDSADIDLIVVDDG